jgi:hypothetical protein
VGLVLVLLPLLLKVPVGSTGEFDNAPWEQIRNEIHKGYDASLPVIQILWSISPKHIQLEGLFYESDRCNWDAGANDGCAGWR